MKPPFRLLAALVWLGASLAAVAAEAEPAPDNYAVSSWGDMMWVYGPGTYPSMDTPEMLEKMIEHWKARGYTGISMRTDLGQMEPFIRRNPIPDNKEMAASSGISNPRVGSLLHYVDEAMERFDVHELGSKLSAERGFEWWAWHPHVYSDGAPETVGEPGLGRIWPWSYVYKYEYENQDVITIDREGAMLWMVPEYGYPGLRENKVAEVVHMAKTFGIKNFLLCMRSEVNQLIDPPSHGDQYGFNEVTVRDMKRRYGVDIMTDPRFDWTHPDFDLDDEMVHKWRDLRGSYVTAYYREVNAALKELDPSIRFGVTLSGDHVGPPLGNWRLDWRTWIDEGLIDMIVSPVFFEGTLDHDAEQKHYLTNVRAGRGTVTSQQLRDYIAQSPHRDIKVIQTGGHPYFFRTPPAGADGWRTDLWYSAYTLAWYQRWWGHWMRDMEEHGKINFFRQDFDDFPLGSSGRARGWGDGRYNPETRSCPGVWYHLGDGSDARPHAVDDVVRGDTGRALKLTRAIDGQSTLIAWHNANPDRSNMTNGVDTSITNGLATFRFWVYRPEENAGGLSAYIQDTGAEMDTGLNVAPGTGVVSYSTGREADHGQWVATDYAVPVGQWTQLTMVIDLDRFVYSSFAGDDQEIALGRDIPLVEPEKRFTMLNGVNLPIEVPSFKQFKVLLFVPEGPVDTSTYLDDVVVDWTPTLHYAKPGSEVWFADDFEAQRLDRPIIRRKADTGGSWRLDSDAGQAWTVHNDTSFGEGVQSLMARSDGRLTTYAPDPLTTAADGLITLDLDLFIRSDRNYPFIIPDPETRSSQRVTLGLERIKDGAVLAAAHAGDARWELSDPAAGFTPSQIGIAYDVWNHLQLAIDPSAGTFRVVAQPLGEVPRLVGSGTLHGEVSASDPLRLFIETQHVGDRVSVFDNVRITTGGKHRER
jgi:hypothetical protein